RGPEQGEPDRAAPLRDADAAPPGGERGGGAPGGRHRRGRPRGEEPHVRHEADPRRPDRGGDERGRGRDHRQAGSESVMADLEGGFHDFKPTRGRAKITVVGAGNVGATCAQALAARDYADVVLVDIIENLPQGKALDIDQMGAVLGYEPSIVGTNG